MAMMEEKENVGVNKGTMSDFYSQVVETLELMIAADTCEEIDLEEVRRPILVLGPPGVGKTMGLTSIIHAFNEVLPEGQKLGMKKILLGQSIVGELSGIPLATHNADTGEAKFVKVQSDSLPNEARDGKYGVLFLDEVTTADAAQVLPALALCDDTRNLGGYTLPEGWLVILAGNGPDCANFRMLHDVVLNRVVTIDVEFNYEKDWKGWAQENFIHESIIGFINFQPTWALNIESDMDSNIDVGKAFASPRSWTRLSEELKKIDMREAMSKGRTQDGRTTAVSGVASSLLKKFNSDMFTDTTSKVDKYGKIAGSVVGSNAAAAFKAFIQLNKGLKFDPEQIMQGKETPAKPEDGLQRQNLHMILAACSQRLLKQINMDLERVENKDKDPKSCTYDDKAYDMFACSLEWFYQSSATGGIHRAFLVTYFQEMMQMPGVDTFLVNPKVLNRPVILEFLQDENKRKTAGDDIYSSTALTSKNSLEAIHGKKK